MTTLGYSYTLKRPPDGAWGVKQADGSWTGMVGMVNRKVSRLKGFFLCVFSKVVTHDIFIALIPVISNINMKEYQYFLIFMSFY